MGLACEKTLSGLEDSTGFMENTHLIPPNFRSGFITTKFGTCRDVYEDCLQSKAVPLFVPHVEDFKSKIPRQGE